MSFIKRSWFIINFSIKIVIILLLNLKIFAIYTKQINSFKNNIITCFHYFRKFQNYLNNLIYHYTFLFLHYSHFFCLQKDLLIHFTIMVSI